MKSLSFPVILAAASALVLPWSGPATATGALQRCEAADGTVAYTDRACATLGAKAKALPGELLTRIAREQAAYENTADFDDTDILVANAGRRSPVSGCARSKRQLALDIQGSLALHNVNRLAESYHWVGQSNRQAQQHMLRLERMASQKLKDARYFDAAMGSGAMGGGMESAEAGAASSSGIVQLSLGNASTQQVVDLEVLQYSGCYFVRL
ncbi:MAG: hypothetical protein ABWY34_10965 [Pseudoxanthomonas sp.]